MKRQQTLGGEGWVGQLAQAHQGCISCNWHVNARTTVSNGSKESSEGQADVRRWWRGREGQKRREERGGAGRWPHLLLARMYLRQCTVASKQQAQASIAVV